MQDYELNLIFDPGLGEEAISGKISKIEEKIKSLGGELEKTDKWGIKRLSSRINKAKKLTQGYYVLIIFKGATAVPGKVQGYLKVTENIIRYTICRAVPKQEIEGSGNPAAQAGTIAAVHVGEIQEADDFGQS